MTTSSESGDRIEAVLITGVDPNGLRASLAHTLATQRPNELILTGRSTDRFDVIAEKMKGTYPNAQVRILKLDMASFDSVRSTAVEVNGSPEKSVDILISMLA